MFKKLLFSLSIVLVFAFAAFAQGVYTPAKGSAERTAIFNALRVPVEKSLKQKIQFAAQEFKVQGSWVFVSGALQNMNGGEPNFKGTEYQEAIKAGAFDNNFNGLLRKSGGKWRVVKYQIGCTDVCWEGWWDTYKTPRTIFPGSE